MTERDLEVADEQVRQLPNLHVRSVTVPLFGKVNVEFTGWVVVGWPLERRWRR